MQLIGSADAPELGDYRHLTDASARRAIESPSGATPNGIFIVEGHNALSQLVTSELTVRSVLLTPRRWERHADELVHLRAPVYVAERDVLHSLTGFDVHRGVLASAERPGPRTVDELLGAGATSFVVTESVTDNENIGAIFRTAAAFDYDAVIADRASADPFYRRSVRVSSGWSMRLPHARSDDLIPVLEELERRGIPTVALTPSAAATRIDTLAASGVLSRGHALVVGTEGSGLAPQTIAACRHSCAIPMANGVDSLNVATALAVTAAFARFSPLG